MKTQQPSKYPWKSSPKPLGVRKPQGENHCSIQIFLHGIIKNVRWPKTRIHIWILREMQEIVLISQILGPLEIGGPRLKPF